MNIFTSTSQHQDNGGSKTQVARKRKKWLLAVSLMGLSFLAFSTAWAGNTNHAKIPATHIHLTSLSIQIGPGGFHFGIGSPFYGPAYARPHVHVVPVPRPYWNQSRGHGHHQQFVAPQRHNRGYGRSNDRQRGNFRGNGGGGNRGHRGGHR